MYVYIAKHLFSFCVLLSFVASLQWSYIAVNVNVEQGLNVQVLVTKRLQIKSHVSTEFLHPSSDERSFASP